MICSDKRGVRGALVIEGFALMGRYSDEFQRNIGCASRLSSRCRARSRGGSDA
jgi:hypothetical protein